MPFCSNCGGQLAEGAKFCSKCGSTINGTSNNNTQRKQEWAGSIIKCPNCGEDIPSFTAVCPSCGHELRNTNVSSSVREFAMKLENAKTNKEEITIIRSFPIPNSKEDILEFMILAHSNIVSGSKDDILEAWISKLEQTYQKAKLLFNEDEEFDKFKKIYDKTNKEIKKKKLLYGNKNKSGLLNKATTVLSKALIIVIKNIPMFLGIISYLKAIQLDTAGENGVGFELLGGLLLIISSILLIIRKSSYIEIVLGIASGLLTFKLAGKLDNGSGLQLFGAITLFLVFISFIVKSVKREKK